MGDCCDARVVAGLLLLCPNKLVGFVSWWFVFVVSSTASFFHLRSSGRERDREKDEVRNNNICGCPRHCGGERAGESERTSDSALLMLRPASGRAGRRAGDHRTNERKQAAEADTKANPSRCDASERGRKSNDRHALPATQTQQSEIIFLSQPLFQPEQKIPFGPIGPLLRTLNSSE